MVNDIFDHRLPFVIKDLSDERGFSFALEAGLENFHIVSIRPGRIRGDHFHDYDEVVIVLGGKGIAQIEMGEDLSKKRFVVDNAFFPILFPASVRHVIRNVGDQDFYLVCFSY